MAKLDSPHWNTKLGVCEKHYIPELPCPQCVATKDPDLVLVLENIEYEGWVKPDVPAGFEYLIKC